MEATLLLCDAADEVGGKLYIMGGGWTRLHLADTPTSMALAILLTVDWNETNQRHEVEAVLMDEDGAPATQGDEPIVNRGSFEVGRPVGLKPGSTLAVPIAMSFHGVVLSAGGYVWELKVGGDPKARAAFRVGPYPN